MGDRNPYVLLGIPYGSPRDLATRAFARKAKGQRRARVGESKEELTNLTWALNQVADNIRDPRTALHVYRVPADPGALDPIGDGVLRPGPEFMPRTTPSSDAEWARLLDAAREEAVAVLHEEIATSAVLPQR
ncbi:MAG: hypothetical protein ACT4P1_11430 [Sporichthyaceae bacterium]